MGGRKRLSLPAYWKYLDVATAVGIGLAIAGAALGIYGAYLGMAKLGSEIEIYLALIGIILTIVGLAVTVVVSVLGARAIKAELASKTK